MSGRDQVLGAVRRAVKAGNPTRNDALAQAAIDARLAAKERQIIPERVQLGHQGLVALFVEKAEAAHATVARLDSVDDVPQAVAAYLAEWGLPPEVKIAPDPQLRARSWDGLSVTEGLPGDNEQAAVTGSFRAVAETGTLMLISSPEHPTTLNYLPDNHIVVLRAADVVGAYEDAWDAVRALPGGVPRSVNFVTGPSRTADIEQTLQLGAHGPRRLHILLVGG